MEVEALESIENLRRITIVIPTYNRSKNLRRILKFYSDFPINICVLDGSYKRNLVENKKNITYLYKPNSSLQTRLFLSRSLVHTEFVTLCADDDFVFPSGLIKAIEFLDKNPVYMSTQGRLIRFHDFPDFSWRPDYEKWNNIDIKEINDFKRQKNITKAPQFMYATMRKQVFKSAVGLLKDVNSGSLNMNEYAFQYSTLFCGPYKSINALYGARIEHSKSKVYIELDTWKEKNSNSYKRYQKNIIDLYKTKLDTRKAKILESLVTDIFLTQLKDKSTKHNSYKVRKIRSFIRKIPSLNKFRPIGSSSRILWILTSKNEIRFTFILIRKFRGFLEQNRVSKTLGIID